MFDSTDDLLNFRIDKAERSLQRTIDWVSRHDMRSNGLFGISIAMMGMLSTMVPPFPQWNAAIALSIVATVISFVVTMSSLLLGVLPRTSAPSKSVLFFGSVARMSTAEVQAIFDQSDPRSYLEDIVEQYRINATIVALKFRMLKISMIGITCMFAPWVMSIYFCKTLIGN